MAPDLTNYLAPPYCHLLVGHYRLRWLHDELFAVRHLLEGLLW